MLYFLHNSEGYKEIIEVDINRELFDSLYQEFEKQEEYFDFVTFLEEEHNIEADFMDFEIKRVF